MTIDLEIKGSVVKRHGDVWALGLMSGTSLDGIDAALIRTDGEYVFEFGPWQTTPYETDFKTRLREATHGRGDILAVEHELTLKHAEAVHSLLKQVGPNYKDIHIIGFHGQSVAHRPLERITWQIGNGSLLAEKTGIDVISDFRRRDMAAGGEGAPLVPLYHAALARHRELPISILNIGGIANVTWIGRRSDSASHDLMDLDIMALDTGPGNIMLNEWSLQQTGSDCDWDGKLALSGKSNKAIVEAMLQNSFFDKIPPKSLDRNHFSLEPLANLSKEDGAATLVDFMVSAVEKNAAYFPKPAEQWFITGGGRHNPAIVQALRQRFSSVNPVESLGWIGDALEAQAFAFLAVRSLNGQAISLPTTTGAIRAVTGGAYYRA